MTVSVAGREIIVRPVRVGALPAFLTAIEPIAREMMAGDVLATICRQADRIIDAVQIASGVERSWLEQLDAEQFLPLLTAVMRVNADFFSHRLLPQIVAAVDVLGIDLAREEPIQTGGRTGSSASAEAGSPTET